MAGAMPQNHGRSLREGTALGRRARWLWALCGLVALIAVIVLVFSSDGPAKPGCLHTYLPGAMGAEAFDECGAAARSTCASLRSGSGYSAVEVLELTRACHRAGLPVS